MKGNVKKEAPLKNIAFSAFVVKAIDEEQRVIKGIATTPTPDRVGDIVEPLGVQFKNPMPLLHQHRHSEPVGTVVFEKPTKNGINFTATLPKIEEPGPLKDRVDTAWGEVKHGLVASVSIGFRPIEYSWMDDGGIRFLETEVYELSLVTIPAQAEAVITSIKSFEGEDFSRPLSKEVVNTIKSLDDDKQTSIGNKQIANPEKNKSPGASGTGVKTVVIKPKPKEAKDMNIQEQIEALEATRVQKQKELETIQEKAISEGRTKDATEREAFDTLRDEIKAVDAELKDLRDMEAANVKAAKPVAEQTKAGEVVKNFATVKAPEKLEPGIEFARYAMCLQAAKGDATMAFNIAKKHFPNTERVLKALDFQSQGGKFTNLMKATVEAGTTLDPTWAGPLVDYQNFAGDFVEYLRPRTIIGQFGSGNIPSLNRIPFNVRITGQTSGGSAQWVGEGAPKPLTAFDFTATELRWSKVAAISVLTNDLIRFSDPSAERLVRDGLAGAVIERIDLDFVDPDKAAVLNVSPASITNGLTPIPSSGTDADAIRADIKALWAPFIAANNAPRTAVYIMDSTTALALSMMTNPLGQAEFPGITMNGGTFMGVPVVVSDYLPVDSDGHIVILANARDIWLADDGQVTIDVSREASLQMLDNPTNNSATGTATSMVSMFQTNSTAFLAERFINWARRRSSGVAYLSGVNWGA